MGEGGWIKFQVPRLKSSRISYIITIYLKNTSDKGSNFLLR